MRTRSASNKKKDAEEEAVENVENDSAEVASENSSWQKLLMHVYTSFKYIVCLVVLVMGLDILVYGMQYFPSSQHEGHVQLIIKPFAWTSTEALCSVLYSCIHAVFSVVWSTGFFACSTLNAIFAISGCIDPLKQVIRWIRFFCIFLSPYWCNIRLLLFVLRKESSWLCAFVETFGAIILQMVYACIIFFCTFMQDTATCTEWLYMLVCYTKMNALAHSVLLALVQHSYPSQIEETMLWWDITTMNCARVMYFGECLFFVTTILYVSLDMYEQTKLLQMVQHEKQQRKQLQKQKQADKCRKEEHHQCLQTFANGKNLASHFSGDKRKREITLFEEAIMDKLVDILTHQDYTQKSTVTQSLVKNFCMKFIQFCDIVTDGENGLNERLQKSTLSPTSKQWKEDCYVPAIVFAENVHVSQSTADKVMGAFLAYGGALQAFLHADSHMKEVAQVHPTALHTSNDHQLLQHTPHTGKRKWNDVDNSDVQQKAKRARNGCLTPNYQWLEKCRKEELS